MRGLQSKSLVFVTKLLSRYKPPEWTLAAVVLCSVTALVPTPSSAAECTCDQLSTVQSELRYAKRVEQNFRDHVPTLHPMETGPSWEELERFSARGATVGVPIVDDRPRRAIKYVPKGDGLTDAQRCALSEETLRALKKEAKGSACDGIGEANRAHEDAHVAECVRKGFEVYWRGRHGEEIGLDEANAYAAQAAALRAVIARLLETADVRVQIKMDTYVRSAPGLPGGFSMPIDWDERGEIRAGHIEMRGDLIRLNGKGIMTTDARTVGSCRSQAGCRIRHPLAAG
jgi:hypothetical protein